MLISDIQNKTLYIEDLKSLSTPCLPDQLKRIIIEKNGRVVADSHHYGAFLTNHIVLDLSVIMHSDILPAPPKDTWSLDANKGFSMAITDAGTRYVCNVMDLSKDALEKVSDIDWLSVPPDGVVTISFSHDYIDRDFFVEVFIETYACRRKVDEVNNRGRGIHYRSFDIKSLYTCGKPFRLVFSIYSGGEMREVRSPMYRVVNGDWQQYLFPNRFGALEIFPMSGILEQTPKMEFSIAQNGSSKKNVKTERTDTYRQNTGFLSRQASRVLAGFLERGEGYHYVDGEWKAIVISNAELSISSADSLCAHAFSFTYKEDNE